MPEGQEGKGTQMQFILADDLSGEGLGGQGSKIYALSSGPNKHNHGYPFCGNTFGPGRVVKVLGMFESPPLKVP